MTREEAARSTQEAEHWKAHGEKRPIYREGEYVAINAKGDVYQFSQRNTGSDRQAFQSFLNKTEWQGLDGIDATKDRMKAQADQRNAERLAARQEFTDRRVERSNPNWRPPTMPQDLTAKEITRSAAQAARNYDKGFDKALNTAERATAPAAATAINAASKARRVTTRSLGKAFEGAAKVAEGLFSMFDPGPPLTKAQIEILREQNERNANATEKEAAFDLNKYLYDTQHQEITQRQQQQDQQKQTEREQYERLKNTERGR